MSDLYRLVYASKNLLQGSDDETAAEVARILARSRANNVRVGVTGALMFNRGAFAQVLEGPRQGVEATFERIQRDERHGDVTVLQCGPVEERGFSNWSMAFVGRSSRGQALWNGIAAESGFDPARLDGDAVLAMLHGLVVEEETGAETLPAAAQPGRPTLDAGRVRTEVARIVPVLPTLDAPAPAAARPQPAARARAPRSEADVALAVLKAALADERQRTTELRGTIDALEIALAAARDDLQTLQADRDTWVERAKMLAGALGREAEEARRASRPAEARRAQAPGPAVRPAA